MYVPFKMEVAILHAARMELAIRFQRNVNVQEELLALHVSQLLANVLAIAIIEACA
jgi:hypothetical protein